MLTVISRGAALSAAAAALIMLVAAAPAGDPPPDWAFPMPMPAPIRGAPAAAPSQAPLSVPGSKAAFSQAQIRDIFTVADWFPAEHPALPEVIAKGRKPERWACGYCHTPAGQGRPENATLAGLPAAYIIAEAGEFRAGRRTCARPDYAPCIFMAKQAHAASDAEIAEAAAYFSSLPFHTHLRVVEAANVPKTVPGFGLMLRQAGAGTEPIGTRIIEIADDMERFERRDWHVGITAFVPPGSIARGKALAGGAGGRLACASCHGAGLRGAGLIPPLAGRSPSYIVRQLYDIQYGFRGGERVELMQPVAAHLTPADRVALAAYAASLTP